MALSHIREGAELLAHRIHGAKNLYLNGLQRYHDPKWCKMPLDLYSKAMWILRIILAAILRRLLVCRQRSSLSVLASFCLHPGRLLDLDSQTMRDQSSVSKRLVHGDMQFKTEVTNSLWF